MRSPSASSTELKINPGNQGCTLAAEAQRCVPGDPAALASPHSMCCPGTQALDLASSGLKVSTPVLLIASHTAAQSVEMEVTLPQKEGYFTLCISTPLRGQLVILSQQGSKCNGHLCLMISGEFLWFFRPQLYTHRVSLDEGWHWEPRLFCFLGDQPLCAYAGQTKPNQNKKEAFLTEWEEKQTRHKEGKDGGGYQSLTPKGTEGHFH